MIPQRCQTATKLRASLGEGSTANEEKRCKAEEQDQNRDTQTGHRLEVESIEVMRECGEESQ
jgi:hypothetical protein